MNMIKQKKVEVNGLDLAEQIQNLSDPLLRKKFLELNSKYSQIKNEIDDVSSHANKFDDYLSKMRNITGSKKEDRIRSRSNATFVLETDFNK